jgi:anaerobic ribonucleoside-triphosphate reductase
MTYKKPEVLAESKSVGKGICFERIRRITGYLTGSTDRWCHAKQAEEKERVKHVSIIGGGKE